MCLRGLRCSAFLAMGWGLGGGGGYVCMYGGKRAHWRLLLPCCLSRTHSTACLLLWIYARRRGVGMEHGTKNIPHHERERVIPCIESQAGQTGRRFAGRPARG